MSSISIRVLSTCAFALLCSAQGLASSHGITMTDLTELAASDTRIAFRTERVNPSDSDVSRTVMAYEFDGLTQYALVLRPGGEPPPGGWPVVQFNHGYHPEPAKSGFVASGQSDRPGDYYRAQVQAYAERGFVVVAPDYRGHNVSEGAEFTRRALADAWYARDAIAAFLAIDSLDAINRQQIYMVGHSMGGAITLRAAIALGDRVRAASIWSTSDSQYQANLMTKALAASEGVDDNALPKQALLNLGEELRAQGQGAGLEQFTPLANLDDLRVPLSLQHSALDRATPASTSMSIAAALYLAQLPYQLKIYPGEEHLFSGADFAAAVARDVTWFKRYGKGEVRPSPIP